MLLRRSRCTAGQFGPQSWALAARAVSMTVSLLLTSADPATAQTITRFKVPSPYGAPGSIVAGSDGALWFTEGSAFVQSPGTLEKIWVEPGAIGRVTTAGHFTEFPLPTVNANPGSLTLGPDGSLWFTESLCADPACSTFTQKIGRITMSGDITEFPSPGVLSLAAGPDGNLWFVEGDSFGPAGKIGRMTPAGEITGEFVVGGRPGDITAGPDGALWFTSGGSPALPPFHGCGKSAIGQITTSAVTSLFALPGCDAFALGKIVAASDGNLWFTEVRRAGIGRINPISHVLDEFSIPGTDPGLIAQGPDGGLWFFEGGSQRIGHMTIGGFFLSELQVSGVVGGIVAGPDGAVWFTELEDDRIGRIDVGAQPSCGTGRGQVRPLSPVSGLACVPNR